MQINFKLFTLLVTSIFLLTHNKANACTCPIYASASGGDMAGVEATITDFSCAGGNMSSAVLSFSLQGVNCPSWTIADIIVNGTIVAQGICSTQDFDLSPYFPLTSVAVRAYDNPNDLLDDWVTVSMSIGINGVQPGINFTATDNVCAGTPIQFTNNSQCASTYYWDFGDGNTSTDMNPAHNYANAGYYWVYMSAYNDLNEFIGSSSQSVFVKGHSPSFYTSNDTVCVNDEIQFYDQSYFNSGSNVTYTLNFGDGSSETSTSPWFSFSHSYASEGDYIVLLTINSECGVQNIDTLIHVGNNLPVSSYIQVGGVNGPICPGTEVNIYTDWSQTYLFNYGDGNFGTSQTHSYLNFGTYTPSVTVQNGCGNSATYTADPIVVTNVAYYTGEAYIYGNPGTICPGGSASFGTANAVSFLWNFGDGTTSNVRYPQHLFNEPGLYTVSATLYDGCGNDTILFTLINVVNDLHINPNIELSDDIPSAICIGDVFQYNVYGASQYVSSGSFLWNFGDGNTSTTRNGFHSYNSAGTYDVTCTITNSCGNDTTLFMQVSAGSNVPPQYQFAGAIDDTYCPGDNILLLVFPYNSSGTVLWNMGNGDQFESDDMLSLNVEDMQAQYHMDTYAYQNPGIYTVEATITNACGLSVSEQFQLTIASGSEINDAGFFVDFDEYICLNEPVIFRGYGGNNFIWSFGDQTGSSLSSSALEPVSHSYSEPGTYIVTMIAQNNCGDTVIRTQQVIIPDSEMNIVTNAISSNCLQSNGQAIANVSGPNAPYSYSWTSGSNSNIASNLSAGIYQVTVTDNKGCTNFAIATVSDSEAPTIAISNVIDVSCFGQSNGAINITPIGNTEGIQYQWSNGATSEDVSGLAAGPYEVIVTNGQGCVSVASIQVDQPDQVTLSFNSTPATCSLNNGSAAAIVSGSTGPYVYIWSNGQSGAQATNLGAGFYTLSVIDNQSCLTTGMVGISETNAPGILLDSIVNQGCGEVGSAIYITPIGGSAPYTYLWSNGNTTQDLTGVLPGQHTVTVNGTDGCESSAIYNISYEAPEPNAICVVTVTFDQNNKIAWEKPAIGGISHYKIYKESSSAGLYFHVGTVPYDELSVYVDEVSNPAVQAYRYKISVVDSCDNESPISAHHKTIHLTQNIGVGGEVNLIWSHYEGFNYATYRIMRYDNINGWTQLASLPSNVNSFTDLDAPLTTAISLYYQIEIELEATCESTRVENNNTTRSNRTEAIAGDIENSIDEFEIESRIVLYPNPSEGIVNISLYAGNLEYPQFQILDAQGRIVHQRTEISLESGENVSFDLTDHQPGMYLMKINTNDQILIKRFILK
jgi:PKD repeat protein